MSLSIYFTAGYPQLKDTVTVLQALENEGVQRIEIGIPFSDPLADGPVIQESSRVALENGMSLRVLFGQLKERKRNSNTSMCYLMGYLNPILQFGVDDFIREAVSCGIKGVIIPDLPPDIYERQYRERFYRAGLSFIFLVTPQTDEARIRMIDELSTDFIYVVSASATTGSLIDKEVREAFLRRLSGMKLKHEIVVGFGIANKEDYKEVTRYASGAIVGTAFIRLLSTSGIEGIKAFIKQFN